MNLFDTLPNLLGMLRDLGIGSVQCEFHGETVVASFYEVDERYAVIACKGIECEFTVTVYRDVSCDGVSQDVPLELALEMFANPSATWGV